MQAKMADRRETMAGMLSGRPQAAFATWAPLSRDGDERYRPTASCEFVPRGHGSDVASLQPALTVTGVRGQISQLAEDGMSDRAIARELHIGLEEVRIARMLSRQS